MLHCVDEVAAKLATAIGARVRQERQRRGWTLDQLAGAASVSRRMVVSVEQGAVNPSVGTLLRLSDALGVGLPALVEPPEPKAVKVTRRGDGAELIDVDLGRHASGIAVRSAIVVRESFLGKVWRAGCPVSARFRGQRVCAAPESAGSLQIETPTFALTLVSVIVILTVLQFMPALVLGPIADHLSLAAS